MGKEEFKTFVKDNPNLIKYVNNNSMTWQKFYEMFELYGATSTVWDSYKATTSTVSNFSDVVNWFKNIDINSFKESIDNVQRVLGVLEDFNTKNIKTDTYKPRPLYKHFED